MRRFNIFKGRKTPIDRHQAKLRSRDGAMVLRAKRVSMYMLASFLLLLTVATLLMLFGVGIPGRAWDL